MIGQFLRGSTKAVGRSIPQEQYKDANRGDGQADRIGHHDPVKVVVLGKDGKNPKETAAADTDGRNGCRQ